MKTKATSIEEYLAELPADRYEAISAVRKVILDNLPKGYVEAFNWGMISYEVPLSVFPDTYNKQPLMYAALGNQKNHMAVYMCWLSCAPKIVETFKEAYLKTGKKLDMGKGCVRFKKLEHLPLELIAQTIAGTSLEEFVATSKKAHSKG